mmetsp:Transcript_2918/g.5507  ORF Transcript_2918/g.5507 Transcript_2918/m.5507 type:complete len:147 (+) Transcript_2918:371-811(+)|eukprot:CAMPEP_0171335042 /NCGR_PEP_ID=MMETSP0878-20121228/5077_1 /TAXON_ID=67004 /ORGANISM="Thalassiosira weissflogii, Strain CCMP1336" /LENGTH=146 /DNA_ID=CAMNT_0011836251 /DNA_START=293 /DNA_END=736 /DNA_ORIENTATION=+
MVLVKGFMVPLKSVKKCQPSSTVEEVLDLMMESHISCLVIVVNERPTGIVTKTDMCWCYRNKIPLDSQVGDIMPWTAGIKRIRDNIDRDAAAKFFEKHHVHHALVVDENEVPVGLISALDIATEVAKDARAWPWIRNESGRVEMPS